GAVASQYSVLRAGSDGGSSPAEVDAGRSFQYLVQQPVRELPALLRPDCRGNPAPAGSDACRFRRGLRGQSARVPFSGTLVLSADGRRSVRHQPEAPSGTRLAVTDGEVAKVEDLIDHVVSPEDLGMIVSNIGSTPDFSAIYTTNSAMHTA